MSGILSKLFSTGAKELVGEVTNGLDELITSKEEKAQIEAKILETVNAHYAKLAGYQNEILLSESKGNWLQRSWRPILGLSFGFIVIATYFIFPFANIWIKSDDLHTLILELKDNDGFWSLLSLMIGGYTIGRSMEKIAGSDNAKEKAKGLKRFFKKDAVG